MMENLVGILDHIPAASWSLWLLSLIDSAMALRVISGEPAFPKKSFNWFYTPHIDFQKMESMEGFSGGDFF